MSLLVLALFTLSSAPAAERILPLTPSFAELVSALGAESEIVGVTEYTDYPASLKAKPSVGPYPRLNLEAIYRLKPTLLLASKSGNQEGQIEFLKKKGLKVELFTEESFSDLLGNLGRIGAAIHREEAAAQLKAKLEKSRDALQSRAKEAKDGCVVIQLSDRPLIVAGRDSYLSEVLGWLKLKNCFSDLSSRYPQVSEEEIVKRDPSWLFNFNTMGEDGEAIAKRWSKHPKLAAVKLGQVKAIALDELLRPGPRLVTGAEKLLDVIEGKAIH